MRWTKKLGFTIPTAGEDAQHLEHSYIAGGNAKGTVMLENSFAVSYKAKHFLLVPATLLLGIYQGKRKLIFTEKHVCYL